MGIDPASQGLLFLRLFLRLASDHFRFGAFGNGLTSWFAGDAVNPFTFVMMIAASAALALGLAYLKGRFS